MAQQRSGGMSRRQFVQVAGVGVAGLAVGGVGGFALGGGVGGGTGSGDKAGVIKIGSASPITGSYAGDGNEMVRGQQMAIDEINARGGIGGKQLQLVTADVGDFTNEAFVNAFQRLAEQEKVAAIFAGYTTTSSVEFEVNAKTGVPLFHLNTLDANVKVVRDDYAKYGMIFEGDPTEVWYGKGFAPFVQGLVDSGAWTPSAKKVAILTSDDPYSISIATQFQDAMKGLGWEVSLYEQVTSGTVEWGPTLTKIRANPPGLIFNTDYIPADLAAFMKQFAPNPTQSLVYQQYGPSVPEYLDLAGEAANGVIWSTTIGTLPDDIGKDFLARFEAKFKAKAGLSQAGGQYDLVRLWAQAVAMSGGDAFNFLKVRDYVLNNNVFRGVSGGYAWNKTDNSVRPYPDDLKDPGVGMAHQTYQIQAGKQVLIDPIPYIQGKFQLPSWLKG
jgi:branched-chain amino acid transport system substrate-binding protein